MRLLVDAHVLDGKYQGTRTYIEGIYKYMVNHNDIDFYFAANNIENLSKTFGCANNIHFIQLKSNNSIKRLAYEFPLLIKRYKIDYAHFQYISPLIKCCKEIVTVHDILFLDYPQFFPKSYKIKNSILFKRSAQRADILLTLSSYSRDAINKHFNIPKSNIYITPNAVTLPEKECQLPDIKKKFNIDRYILSVSRIEPRKNHQLLLQAFVELKLYKKEIKQVLVGVKDLKNKEFYNYYDNLTDEIKKYILIIQVPYLDLVALYKQALLFIFPSFAEGFGIPPIEAIMYDCPTLCSNQTAMKEFDFLNSFLFSPYNIEELKSKITDCLNGINPTIIKEQKKKILEKYNWEKISDDIYNLIKSKEQGM